MTDGARAAPRYVPRASLLPNISHGAYGESLGSSRATRTFHGQTCWDVWRHNRFEIPLGTRTPATGVNAIQRARSTRRV